MKPRWEEIESPTEEGKWVVAFVHPLVNGDARVERIHPIAFDKRIEAVRAAARLNDRDERADRIEAMP